MSVLKGAVGLSTGQLCLVLELDGQPVNTRITVLCRWAVSRHVGHLVSHPRTYTRMLTEFLGSLCSADS